MKNNYVLNHDYGYGREPEQEELNKLNLRNIDDLKVYIGDIISHMFVAKVKNNMIQFLEDQSKVEVIIEKL